MEIREHSSAMQRTAQDWIVFTELTHHDAAAVGFVLALQFGPSLILLPLAGHIADHFDRRRVLIVTQSLQSALALGLGVLTLRPRREVRQGADAGDGMVEPHGARRDDHRRESHRRHE